MFKCKEVLNEQKEEQKELKKRHSSFVFSYASSKKEKRGTQKKESTLSARKESAIPIFKFSIGKEDKKDKKKEDIHLINAKQPIKKASPFIVAISPINNTEKGVTAAKPKRKAANIPNITNTRKDKSTIPQKTTNKSEVNRSGTILDNTKVERKVEQIISTKKTLSNPSEKDTDFISNTVSNAVSDAISDKVINNTANNIFNNFSNNTATIPKIVLPTTPIPSNLSRLSIGSLFANTSRSSSVFKARRESLIGHAHIYNGQVSPSDFYRYSNSSLDSLSRIKQVLTWCTKYVAARSEETKGITAESLGRICEKYLKKIQILTLKKNYTPSPPLSESVQEMLASLQRDTSAAAAEIDKWKSCGAKILAAYTISVPLFCIGPTSGTLESVLSSNTPCISTNSACVSFDATFFSSSPAETLSLYRRRLDDLKRTVFSVRYFVCLSVEYSRKVCASLLQAAHPVDKARANAFLQALCQMQGKSRK